MSGISVVMPIDRVHDRCDGAMACVLGQSHAALEVIVVANGSDPGASAWAGRWAARDRRVHAMHVAEHNLSIALNAGVRRASNDLVARMDCDDRCSKDRLRIQGEWMRAHPEAGAVGSWFDVVEEGGAFVGRQTPPSDPGVVRRRLLRGNCFAHGSMVLRRDAVIEAGGYDPSFVRAQDLDLWLRLSRRYAIGAVEQPLYTHAINAYGPSEQALRSDMALRALAAEWSRLPATGRHACAPDEPDLVSVLSEQVRASLHRSPELRAADFARAERVRSVARTMREHGAHSCCLWGAGAHTRWLLRQWEAGLPDIQAIIDDEPRVDVVEGIPVVGPAGAGEASHVLISSDRYEEEIWQRTAPMRRRGVHVWRLYAPNDESRRVRLAS